MGDQWSKFVQYCLVYGGTQMAREDTEDYRFWKEASRQVVEKVEERLRDWLSANPAEAIPSIDRSRPVRLGYKTDFAPKGRGAPVSMLSIVVSRRDIEAVTQEVLAVVEGRLKEVDELANSYTLNFGGVVIMWTLTPPTMEYRSGGEGDPELLRFLWRVGFSGLPQSFA